MLFPLIGLATIVAQPFSLTANQREDLRCFEATAWALSWMGESTADGAVPNVRYVSYYFLGRLTADNDIDWLAYTHSDMNLNRKSEADRGKDLHECTDIMYRRATSKVIK
jgi:hypothetical protein